VAGLSRGCRRNRNRSGWAHAARGSARCAAARGEAVGTIPVSPSKVRLIASALERTFCAGAVGTEPQGVGPRRVRARTPERNSRARAPTSFLSATPSR
jgi:hypothetical protein